MEFDEVSMKSTSHRIRICIFLKVNYLVSVFILRYKIMQFFHVEGTQRSLMSGVEGTQQGMLRVRNILGSCNIELPNTVVP